MSSLFAIPYFYKSPTLLLNELGIDAPHEIEVEAIAQYCGATLVYEPLEGSESRLVGYKDKAIITVNKKSTLTRQRFSAAHELGHWVWDRYQTDFLCKNQEEIDNTWGTDFLERRANHYAAELLLPQSMLLPYLKSTTLSFALIEMIAGLFQTSFVATCIRVVELCSFPAILIFSEDKQMRWSVKSPSVTYAFKLHDRLPCFQGSLPLGSVSEWFIKRPKELKVYNPTFHVKTSVKGNNKNFHLLTWESDQVPTS